MPVDNEQKEAVEETGSHTTGSSSNGISTQKSNRRANTAMDEDEEQENMSRKRSRNESSSSSSTSASSASSFSVLSTSSASSSGLSTYSATSSVPSTSSSTTRSSTSSKTRKSNSHSKVDVIPSRNLRSAITPIVTTFEFPDAPKEVVFPDGYKLYSHALRKSGYPEPLIIVECLEDDSLRQTVDTSRVQIVNEYECQLPVACNDAREAQKKGLWQSTAKFPGIPDRKNSDNQYKRVHNKKRCWFVQGVFERYDDSSRLSVQYEGFSTIIDQDVQEIKTSAPEAYYMYKIRDAFLRRIERKGSEEEKKNAKKMRLLMDEDVEFEFLDHNSPFWLLQDLTYFHTALQRQHKLGPLIYVALDGVTLPKAFSYSPINVFKSITYKRCIEKDENKPFLKLIENKLEELFEPSNCENKEKCVCNRRFNALYFNQSNNLIPDEDGLLNFRHFDSCEKRIVVECSDECGCSSECPRRNLQRGQQIPLIIYHEGRAGFGVRAGAPIKGGQFICEYVGEGYYKDLDCGEEEKAPVDSGEDIAASDKDTSYESDFQTMDQRLIICASKIGNVARFLNHRCDPNVVFIETYSRELEADVLIPRISVYALKDISFGEPLCLCYYDLTDAKSEVGGIKCECGSLNCIEWLPMER
uniref:SET domain-containing protein n=1 Tax=Caenorhabditis tropicalis TaxID=1561998 RepID=A0A1I7TLP1_9PELO